MRRYHQHDGIRRRPGEGHRGTAAVQIGAGDIVRRLAGHRVVSPGAACRRPAEGQGHRQGFTRHQRPPQCDSDSPGSPLDDISRSGQRDPGRIVVDNAYYRPGAGLGTGREAAGIEAHDHFLGRFIIVIVKNPDVLGFGGICHFPVDLAGFLVVTCRNARATAYERWQCHIFSRGSPRPGYRDHPKPAFFHGCRCRCQVEHWQRVGRSHCHRYCRQVGKIVIAGISRYRCVRDGSCTGSHSTHRYRLRDVPVPACERQGIAHGGSRSSPAGGRNRDILVRRRHEPEAVGRTGTCIHVHGLVVNHQIRHARGGHSKGLHVGGRQLAVEIGDPIRHDLEDRSFLGPTDSPGAKPRGQPGQKRLGNIFLMGTAPRVVRDVACISPLGGPPARIAANA